MYFKLLHLLFFFRSSKMYFVGLVFHLVEILCCLCVLTGFALSYFCSVAVATLRIPDEKQSLFLRTAQIRSLYRSRILN